MGNYVLDSWLLGDWSLSYAEASLDPTWTVLHLFLAVEATSCCGCPGSIHDLGLALLVGGGCGDSNIKGQTKFNFLKKRQLKSKKYIFIVK